MLFCAHLMIQVKHRPYLPPLLPQRPRCPQPRSSYPGCAAPGPLLPAVPRGSHTAAARPPPPTQGSGRAAPGPRLQPPGAGEEAAPPAGCGPGRPLQSPGLQRGRGAGGGAAPRGPEPAMAAPERLGAVPRRSPGRGRVERGAGTGWGLRGAPR